MEMHDRIRELRKNHLNLSQEAFGERLGVSRSVINNIERNALARPEQKLSLMRLMCKEFNVREEWILNGTEPMLVQPDTFSLDAFIKEQGMSDLELRILKRYFALDAKIRQDALAYFLGNLESEKMERNSATMLREEFEECPRTPESMDQAYPSENHKAI